MHTIYILIAVNRSQVNKNTINVPLWLRKRDIHLPRPQRANIISLAVSVINCAGLGISLEDSAGTGWPWSRLLVILCQKRTDSQGFELALSQVTWKIIAYVTVLDTESIFTQFLFSQVQLYISRATGEVVKLTVFLRQLQPPFWPCFPSLTLSRLFSYRYNMASCFPKYSPLPNHNTKHCCQLLNFEQQPSVILQFKYSGFAF